MFAYADCWSGFHWWWLLPIAMMLLCLIMMRGRMGCWPKSRSLDEKDPISPSHSAREILDKRYALGEIGKAEYEEKKRDLA